MFCTWLSEYKSCLAVFFKTYNRIKLKIIKNYEFWQLTESLVLLFTKSISNFFSIVVNVGSWPTYSKLLVTPEFSTGCYKTVIIDYIYLKLNWLTSKCTNTAENGEFANGSPRYNSCSRTMTVIRCVGWGNKSGCCRNNTKAQPTVNGYNTLSFNFI